MGPKDLATPTYFISSPRPTLRRKKCSRTNEESPNGLETSLRMIPFSAIPDPRREERHAIEGSFPERPKKKDKYSKIAMGAWCRSNSRRNCHLRIKCP